MEQDVDNVPSNICNTCLSSDRDLIIINRNSEIYQIFRLLMYDFAGDTLNETRETTQWVCWECLALLRRFKKFKKQVHTAQEHLRVLGLSGSQESTTDHTYLSQSLSPLESSTKMGYDKIYFDYTTKLTQEWSPQYIAISTSDNIKNEQYDVAQVVRENINLELDSQILGGIVIDNPGTVIPPHIVINAETLVTQESYKDDNYVLPDLTISSQTVDTKSDVLQIQGNKTMTAHEDKTDLKAGYITEYINGEDMLVFGPMPDHKTDALPVQENKPTEFSEDKPDLKAGYTTEYMSEEDMLAFREEAKQKIQYANAVYRCELCIIGFYNQHQVEEHYVSAHNPRAGTVACKVCFAYVEEEKQPQHVRAHYLRHVCRLCGHTEQHAQLAHAHAQRHRNKRPPAALIQIADVPAHTSRKKKQKEEASTHKPGKQDLRKLLSKTTIVAYKCLECDMFFKNSRARKTHVARYHREGLQCDHCKKRFVNRTTLATHLRLHEGPPPREECQICHKMVRVIQLKYHIQRHQDKSRYECTDCKKVFSHLTTYHAHLKYSRAHASEHVFKYPCPMCNKGYPTKEAMQDHFNYHHLGKTSHKCPVCNKPIASKANVEKHMMRLHGEKKEKPRNHVCQQCGKAFTDKKALNQHEVIHSGERPLSCDICQQTFKQKASLYTHKKRVHNVVPAKRVVEFMETKKGDT